MTANGASYETAPPPNCPKCSKPLNVYRLLHFAICQQEPFEFYLCHEHGFFLHDQRRTEAGLLTARSASAVTPSAAPTQQASRLEDKDGWKVAP